MIDEYYDEIRRDIAKDFGLEAAGYGPAPKMIPVRIAQRIVAKYPGTDRFTPHPKALQISQRYMAIFSDRFRSS